MSESEQGSPIGRRDEPTALRLDGVSDAEAELLLFDMVRTHTLAILSGIAGRKLDSLHPERSFQDLGLDSLGALELHRRLTLSTATVLPTTVVFDHPTLPRSHNICALRSAG